MIMGGKSERMIEQFKFEPVQVLKGVFSREALLLTSDDLGFYRFADAAPIKRGQTRLLILGRSSEGYAIWDQSPTFEHTVPPLRDANDPLLEAVKVILAVNGSRERQKKVVLLLDGLRAQEGPAVVPLLAALIRRSLLAAQMPGAMEVVTKHLSEPSPAVREQAAKTLHALLDANYLDQRHLREAVVRSLRASLERSNEDIPARAAALEALGAAGMAVLTDRAAILQLQLGRSPLAFAEQSSRLRAIGQLKIPAELDPVMSVVAQMPLDAPAEMEHAAEWALTRLDPSEAIEKLSLRIKKKLGAGFSFPTEIRLFGELPVVIAVPALLDVSKLPLEREERAALAFACRKMADSRLIPALAGLLEPREPEVRWNAVEALMKIDTDDAASTLQSILPEETDLFRKLEIAEFLGRHGIRDGYPYAIEHMSEPSLREQAVAALAAIQEPRARPQLDSILQTSNDLNWKSAAVRALGRLGEVKLEPQFLEMAQNFKDPLAPSAIVALGDLGEVRAVDIVRAGLTSRSREVLTASARAAAKLLALPNVRADDVHDQISLLLADPDAPQEARAEALKSLIGLNDGRLDGALNSAVRDAGLEGTSLLDQVEKVLRDRKVKLTLT
jgi:HEAT repeat protein